MNKRPTVQVLVAAMDQNDHSLPDKMNIQSDVIVGNQCNTDGIETFDYNGFTARYLNFKERGVGLNRNNALMRATGDYCLFADDDMVYCDGYPEIVIRAFSKHKDADVIIFNLHEDEQTRFQIKKDTRINRFNYLRYGAARIAVRLSSIRMNGIFFNQCFGGGSEHLHGEDSLFLTACLDKKLKIYAVPDYIARLTDERPSTWKRGFDDRYLKDQGILYKAISPKYWRLLCLQDAVRRSGSYDMSCISAYRRMLEGVKEAD